MGLLTPMARDISVTEGTGQTVTLTAIFAGLVALTVALIIGRLDRKLIMLTLCGLAIGSDIAAAQAEPKRSRHLVDPETLAALDKMPELVFSDETLAAIRKAAPPQLEPSPYVIVSERIVPGVDGNPDIRVLVVTPAGTEPGAPGLFHIHGGGYVSGTPEMFLGRLTQIATGCGCVSVSTTYRLAPETRWPGALDDIYTAFRWMHDNAAALGVDPERIAITGESAGGGHAAALALRARDRGGPPILMQLLVYPMLDDRPVPEAHYPGDYIWTRASDHYGWTALLGVPAGSNAVPKGAVPGRVEDLSGLPPTYIAVGSLDLFVDANLEFARRLIAAGVPTELHVVPGAWHGFEVMAAEATISRQFTQEIIHALNSAFARSRTK